MSHDLQHLATLKDFYMASLQKWLAADCNKLFTHYKCCCDHTASLGRRGYIYGAVIVKGHRYAMITAAVQSLDGAKPNTNPKFLTVILT